jgi:hypothetical protein
VTEEKYGLAVIQDRLDRMRSAFTFEFVQNLVGPSNCKEWLQYCDNIEKAAEELYRDAV